MGVLLSEIIRPNRNRDELGQVGEALHQLADLVAEGPHDNVILLPPGADRTDKRVWKQVEKQLVIAGLNTSIDPVVKVALNRVSELANRE